MALYSVGINAKTHSVEVREKFALLDQQIINRNQKLIDENIVDEIVTLSTCNRLEHYFITDKPVEEVALLLFDGCPPENLHVLDDSRTSHHLFEVTSGLVSQVLGENEILGQVKKSYNLAQENGHTKKHLNVLFQKAVYVGKRVRTITDISKSAVSTGGIIIDKIKNHFDDLYDVNVLLIGAGDISRAVAASLYQKGVKNIFITNRSKEKGEMIAKELEASYVPVDKLYEKIAESEVVISSTTAPHYLIAKSHKDYLSKGKKLLIDLAVPRDIEPGIDEDLDNIELVNIDSITTITDSNKQRRFLEVQRAGKIIALENCNYCCSRLEQEECCIPSTLNFLDFNKLYKSHKAHT